MSIRFKLRLALAAPLTMLCLTGLAHGQYQNSNQSPEAYGQEYSQYDNSYGYETQQVGYNYADPQASCSDCASGACGDAGCDTCDAFYCALDDCDRCPNWYAGTEFTFLATDTGNASATRTAVVNGADGLEVFSNGDLDDFTYAPRIWLGRQFGKWGVVARYWQLSDSDGDNVVFLAPFATPGSAYSQNLRMETLDLEVTRSGCWNCWKVDGSAGVRYASFENSSSSSAIGLFNGGLDIATAHAESGTSFSGTGLTAALTGRRQLGCSNLHLFASGRGSVLWGDAEAYATTESMAISFPTANALTVNGAYGDGNTEMWIGEFQVGVQWEYALECLPAVAFFRTAFEYQYWNIQGDGGAAAASFAIANGTGAFAEAASGASDVHLYGLSVGTGLTW